MIEKRELGDLTPIRGVLEIVKAKESAALDVRAAAVAEVLADVRKALTEALAEAVRPPAEGLTAQQLAELKGKSRWWVYKQLERGLLQPIGRNARGEYLFPYDAAA